MLKYPVVPGVSNEGTTRRYVRRSEEITNRANIENTRYLAQPEVWILATRQIYGSSINSDFPCLECLQGASCTGNERRVCRFTTQRPLLNLSTKRKSKLFAVIIVFRSIVNDHRSNDYDPARCEATIEIRLETRDSFRNEWHRENEQSRRLLVTEGLPAKKLATNRKNATGVQHTL